MNIPVGITRNRCLHRTDGRYSAIRRGPPTTVYKINAAYRKEHIRLLLSLVNPVSCQLHDIGCPEDKQSIMLFFVRRRNQCNQTVCDVKQWVGKEILNLEVIFLPNINKYGYGFAWAICQKSHNMRERERAEERNGRSGAVQQRRATQAQVKRGQQARLFQRPRPTDGRSLSSCNAASVLHGCGNNMRAMALWT